MDPLVYVHLTRYLTHAGSGMLVDPYFKADFIPWLAETTSIRRVLTSSRHHGAERELKLLGVALATVPNAADLQVRASESRELHDRCVLGEDGSVRIIVSSVTGIGKNLTSVITRTSPTSEVTRSYRDKYEKLWEAATPVAAQSPGTRVVSPGKQPSLVEPDAGRLGGELRHHLILRERAPP